MSLFYWISFTCSSVLLISPLQFLCLHLYDSIMLSRYRGRGKLKYQEHLFLLSDLVLMYMHSCFTALLSKCSKLTGTQSQNALKLVTIIYLSEHTNKSLNQNWSVTRISIANAAVSRCYECSSHFHCKMDFYSETILQ